ncbi:PLP-dependent transferase [Aspergillus steynii IBT 23096]|uniref:PLP-dependent transferase n=1 Tax=Aspergillus steynii IBT 23096 TaxID=1392250 RepID=A0A2I2GMI9_9EURO|nr:PLP-dependent transferase [Aspergillus steynii IBT 23096]PLB54096.1 PLP-dependent transferase [Aspergillus steynii IBT 23096]
MEEDNGIHQAISAFFIGPHAENMYFFRKHITVILDELESARQSYAPNDKRAITTKTQVSPQFAYFSSGISEAIRSATKLLSKHSIPYWSPRYGAHMCSDLSIPALLGYFMGMMYNPNNITPEVSPLTTAVEVEVGNQFCQLFGYNVGHGKDAAVTGWGHITCDGTVANIEAMWVARNLKHYPLTLWLAIAEGELAFIAGQFLVETCVGTKRLFRDMDTWELLNLRPEVVLDLPAMLHRTFGISQRFLDTALAKYSVQNAGKEVLDKRFGIDKQMQFILGKTNHYSWGKGGGILGIGANNVVGVDVDLTGRIDLELLKAHLQERLDNKQAIYAVVATVGSTEVGAVDKLASILTLRREFQAQGLSFLVLADAAWGGYFATMLPRDQTNLPITSAKAARLGKTDEQVPHAMKLSADTEASLAALRFADSITVDPHKAGYVPYPAGGVVYRDKRMGGLVSCTGPYLARGSTGSMGVNGLQGSKPGAATMSVWLSNHCIGLNASGYGALLAEMAAHWVTLASENDSFICVPFNRLPKDIGWIWNMILHRSYSDILKYDAIRPDEKKIMPVLRNLGSDLNINAVALNWRYQDERLNTDAEEANNLMRRVVKRLSIDLPNADPAKVPFYLTSTEFSVGRYGKCLASYKKRLGLEESDNSLIVLRNTVMNPFMGLSECFKTIMNEFRKVVEEEVAICRDRNTLNADRHDFYLHGTGTEVYLVSRPCFRKANHRHQVIFATTLPAPIRTVYEATKTNNPLTTCSVRARFESSIDHTIASLKANGRVTITDAIYEDRINPSTPFPRPLTLSRTIAHHSLSRSHQDAIYPDEMPFYLYGNPSQSQWNISHIIVRAPNIVLNAHSVHLDLDTPENPPATDLIVTFAEIHEASRQPFPDRNEDLSGDFFSRPGERFRVNVWRDPGGWGEGRGSLMERLRGVEGGKVAMGWLRLGEDVFVDVEEVNGDDEVKDSGGGDEGNWLDEFELMGKN